MAWISPSSPTSTSPPNIRTELMRIRSPSLPSDQSRSLISDRTVHLEQMIDLKALRQEYGADVLQEQRIKILTCSVKLEAPRLRGRLGIHARPQRRDPMLVRHMQRD